VSYTIRIAMQLESKFNEIFPENQELTEITIESLVASVLLELFDTVMVEDVTVEYTPTNIDIEVPGKKLTYLQTESINDAVKRIEANIKNKTLAEPFSSKRVKSVVLEKERIEDSSIVNEALKIARDKSLTIEREASNASLIDIRVKEKPLTAQNFTALMSALTELHAKCWLIKQERFADLIEYAEINNARFLEEANLIIVKLKHNSPVEIKLDAGVKDIAEALKNGIDAVAQAGIRHEEAKLKNQALATDTKLKEEETQAKLADKEQNRHAEAQRTELEKQKALLEIEMQQLQVEKQRVALQRERLELEIATRDFVFETADMMVTRLYPNADLKTRLMLSRTLVPNLLQLTNIKGLELDLPTSQEDQEENRL